MRLCLIGSIVVLGGQGALPASQDAGTAAQSKLLARRSAEADCYRKLAEIVYGVRIDTDTYVRDFVAESDDIQADVEAFVAGVRLGSPRYFADGTCEVDAEVSVEKLVTVLTETHRTHYWGNRISHTDIANIQNRVKVSIYRVTGSGVPRADLPPALPEKIEARLPAVPSSVSRAKVVPDIWKDIAPQGRLLAERAARLDAMRKLLEQIKGLRLNSNTLMRDFMAESDEISTHADGIVFGAAEVHRYLHHGELIAEVTMEVPVEMVIERVRDLHVEHYHGYRVTTTDITDIKKHVRKSMIRATGSGVPPRRFLREAKNAGLETPDWLSSRIRATATATDDRIDTAQGKLRALRAARAKAMTRMTLQVYALSLPNGQIVGEMIEKDEQIVAQLQAVFSTAVSGAPTFTEREVTVEVSIQPGDLWSVIHQHLLIVRRRG